MKELDKMIAVKADSQTISTFLDWLDAQPFTICKFEFGEFGEYCPIRSTKEQLLAGFFGIDLNKCEQERQQILDDLQKDGR